MSVSLILFVKLPCLQKQTMAEETTEGGEEPVVLTATVDTATFNNGKITVSAIINTNLPVETLERQECVMLLLDEG
ncbi:hypothetical protein ACSS6N_21360 [Peribacillus frigoritolerans]|uniref:hypothetical protein n=1 Tax=Peribacillus frigoritolerans TaxID=450367 RepID=UPI003F85985A